MSDLEDIHARNLRVEADKAWETCWTRRFIIAAGTYIIVAVYLAFLGVDGFLFHAAVPPAAYFISTLTLPFIKRIWIDKFYNPKP